MANTTTQSSAPRRWHDGRNGSGGDGGGVRRTRGRERDDPARADDDARRVPRRGRALRHQLRVHGRGRGGRLDHPVARRADEGRAGWRLDAAAPHPRGAARAGPRRGPGARRATPPTRRCSSRRRSTPSTSRSCVAAATRWGSGRSSTASCSLPTRPRCSTSTPRRSPVFMAARFDASRAAELDQQRGDGTPIMLTIPTDDPWVPLRILGLGLDARQAVAADVFLLTPDRPELLAGGSGLSLARASRPRVRCSTTCAPTRGWGGSPTTSGSRTSGSTPRRATSTTTSRCRRTRGASRRRHGRCRARNGAGRHPRRWNPTLAHLRGRRLRPAGFGGRSGC